MLARINKMPDKYKFICLMLEARVPGKREHNEKLKDLLSSAVVKTGAEVTQARDGGITQQLFFGRAIDLTWHTILPWLA